MVGRHVRTHDQKKGKLVSTHEQYAAYIYRRGYNPTCFVRRLSPTSLGIRAETPSLRRVPGQSRLVAMPLFAGVWACWSAFGDLRSPQATLRPVFRLSRDPRKSHLLFGGFPASRLVAMLLFAGVWALWSAFGDLRSPQAILRPVFRPALSPVTRALGKGTLVAELGRRPRYPTSRREWRGPVCTRSAVRNLVSGRWE